VAYKLATFTLKGNNLSEDEELPLFPQSAEGCGGLTQALATHPSTTTTTR